MKPKTILLILLLVFCTYAQSNPIDEGQSSNELNDLNKILRNTKANEDDAETSTKEVKNLPMLNFFDHHDENNFINLDSDSKYKYDVELLESVDLKKETEEFEEQFRGAAALHMDTNNFSDEDIEVHALPKSESISHFALLSALAVFVICALIIYVVIITWRNNLEQRYGARILLVTNSDDDDDLTNRMNNRVNRPDIRHLPLNPV